MAAAPRHFYLSLPSDASTNAHPSNTSSEFVVDLPHDVDLSGDWEVALSEIVVPRVWNNVLGRDYWFRLNERHFALPDGRYDGILDVLKTMAEQINDARRRHPSGWPKASVVRSPDSRWWNVPNRDMNLFFYGANMVHFDFRTPRRHDLLLSPALGEALGFDGRAYASPTWIFAGRPARLDSTSTAFVYADIVEPVAVGDAKVQLLRVVFSDGGGGKKPGDELRQTFSRPSYVPLKTKRFRSIEVNITDDAGEALAFGAGRSSLLLHFRRAPTRDGGSALLHHSAIGSLE